MDDQPFHPPARPRSTPALPAPLLWIAAAVYAVLVPPAAWLGLLIASFTGMGFMGTEGDPLLGLAFASATLAVLCALIWACVRSVRAALALRGGPQWAPGLLPQVGLVTAAGILAVTTIAWVA
jgi:hypothetical protein